MGKVKTVDEILDNESCKPETKDNHVGIEIEFYSIYDSYAIGRMILSNDLGDYVRLGDDGSIEPCEDQFEDCDCCCPSHCNCEDIREDYYSHEMRILATEKQLSKVINKVGVILKECEAKVNKTCGLHVHIDMRNRDVAQCYKKLVNVQDVLFDMVKSHRKESTYCTKNQSPIYDSSNMYTDPDRNRYTAINKMAYGQHRTLEVRLHHGTVNAEEIKHWAKLLCGIVNSTAKAFPKAAKKYDELKKGVRLTKATDSYVKKQLKMNSKLE